MLVFESDTDMSPKITCQCNLGVDEDKQNFEFKKFIKIFQTCQTWLDFRVVLSFTCYTRQKNLFIHVSATAKREIERETHNNNNNNNNNNN